MKGECLFQVPPLENQISTVEKEMRTTQSREVDFIKFEKRKRGDRDPWLAPLNSYLLRIFLKPPPASSAIGDAPVRLCSAPSAGHSPRLKHPIPRLCTAEAERHALQLPLGSMSTHTFNVSVCVSGSWNQLPTAKTVLWLLCSWQAADAAAIPACPVYNLSSLWATGRHCGTRTILINFLGGQEGKSMTLFLISKAYKHSEK